MATKVLFLLILYVHCGCLAMLLLTLHPESRLTVAPLSNIARILEGLTLAIKCSSSKVTRASLVAQLVKNPPAVWETWVRSLGWEDPLEKGTATHSSILAWRIPQTV